MVVLILLVAWYGIRRMLLTPLAKIIAHIREIAGGNLANTLTIDGRSEMGDLAQSVSHSGTVYYPGALYSCHRAQTAEQG